MSELSDVKDAVAVLLTAAGVTPYTYIPERLNVPAAVLSPGSPYLEFGPAVGVAFGEVRVNLVLSLVVSSAGNESSTNALDQLLQDAATALRGSFDLGDASPFYAYSTNAATYLAADLRLSDLRTF